MLLTRLSLALDRPLTLTSPWTGDRRVGRRMPGRGAGGETARRGLMRGRVSWRLATPSCVATLSTPRHHTPTRRAPHGSSNSNLNPNLPLTLPLTLTLILTLILTRRAAWLFCACSDALPRWLDSQASTACTLHTAHCTRTLHVHTARTLRRPSHLQPPPHRSSRSLYAPSRATGLHAHQGRPRPRPPPVPAAAPAP